MVVFTMRITILCLCLLSSLTNVKSAGPIGTFLQTNAVGLPVLHERQTWIFDPDVALRRRKQFIELNGYKGEKLIERLGLGVDGYEEERLRGQRFRDDGHLGGLNWLRP